MELKPAETSSWIPGILPASIETSRAKAILLFGPDQGGVFEFARLAGRQGGDVEIFSAADAEVSSVVSSLSAGSLFGGATSVRLDGADDRHVKRIEDILETPFSDGARLVVSGGDLKPSSKLRKLFAQRKDCLSAPLYMMKDRDLGRFATGLFRSHGMTLSAEAGGQIAAHLSGDRATAARSCEVVALHAMGRNATSVERIDIQAVLESVDEDGIVAPFDLALDGKAGPASAACTRRLMGGESFVGMLRIFAMRAFRLRALLEGGQSPRAAVEKAKPPIFWTERDLVVRLLGKLSVAKMDRILELLDQAERRIIEERIAPEAALPALMLDIARHGAWKDPT